MAYQMPFNTVAADLENLRLGFLNLVLTKNRCISSHRLSQGFHRMHFADGDQFDLVRATTGTTSGTIDPRTDDC